MGVADVEGDGEAEARYTPAGLGDHGRVSVGPHHPPLRAYPLCQAARLVPEPAAHVQDLIPFPDRADIEHLPPDLLDQGVLCQMILPDPTR